MRTKGASTREVASWDQPILTQKHGGVLAFLARNTKRYGVQFLLNAKTEPGDNGDIKLSPSFQATQSNINKAHGGCIPKLSNIILNNEGAKLIYATSHNEEGARFWEKTNINLILLLDDSENEARRLLLQDIILASSDDEGRKVSNISKKSIEKVINKLININGYI